MCDVMKVFLGEDAIIPDRAHELDAGLDLMSPRDFKVPAHGFIFIDTKVAVQLPPSTRGHICSKSGLNRYLGITADGTVDEGYTGSIGVTLHNDSDIDVDFRRGNKIAQLVVEPILRPSLVEVAALDQLEAGDRGQNGYGSTGD